MAEEKDSKSESKGEQPEDERQFSQEHYDRLIECSKKGSEGIEEWNEWRAKNLLEEIWLEGADLELAKLQGAKLENANLQGADLNGAKLQGAKLFRANLQGASLFGAKLEEAYLWGANLQGAYLFGANLQGAKFTAAIVDGVTSFLRCKIDKDTDFRDVGLENVCIESGTKYLLKYNIRRMNWEDWYGKHWFLQWPIRAFWWVSDYGISTGRIMFTFFNLAVWFAVIYLLWPGCVMVNGVVGDIRGTVHAIYFSVVTMTTLGFGDIAANPDSWQGQVALMVQVLLGYVLLGALITRFAVLFTSDGPAGSYTAMGEETKALLGKLKGNKGKAG